MTTTPTTADLSSRLVALSASDAAALLLGADESASSASFRRLAAADLPTAFTPPPSDSFESIATLSLPDNPPGGGGPRKRTATEVHRFVLAEGVASELNARLRRDAVAHSRFQPGSSISNVGGYHSEVVGFERSDASTHWYGPLHALLVEALHAIDAFGEAGAVPSERLEISGWLNVSAKDAHNKLHDHGSAMWSAVYFVDDGGGAEGAAALPTGWHEFVDAASGRSYFSPDSGEARDGQATWERPSACAGELLLETQLKAWTSEFAYLPVRPVPGTMWIFPGYMPHAVLPRATSADGALRISVACNVSVRAEAERALGTVWLASRMA